MTASYLEERLNRIVELAYEITCKKIAGGLIKVDNEASFQLHLGAALKTLGEQFVYKKNYCCPVKTAKPTKHAQDISKTGILSLFFE